MLWHKAIGAGGLGGGIKFIYGRSYSGSDGSETPAATAFFDAYAFASSGWAQASGYRENDLLVIIGYSQTGGGTSTLTLSSSESWTNLFNTNYDTGLAGDETVNHAVWYKLAAATESDVTIGSSDESFVISGELLIFRGVDTSTPFDVTYTQATTSGGTSLDLPSITPITEGAVVIGTAGGVGSNGNLNQNITGSSYDLYDDTSYRRANDESDTFVLNRQVVNTWSSGAWDESAWTSNISMDAIIATSMALRPAA